MRIIGLLLFLFYGGLATGAPAAPGPWGALDAVPITLEPPGDHAVIPPGALYPVTWTISPDHAADLRAALADTGEIGADLALAIAAGEVLRPDPAWLAGLDPVTRWRIHAALWHDPENLLSANPFRWPANDPGGWFRRAEVRPEIADQVKRLTFQVGAATLFSDLGLLVPMLQSGDEYIGLLKALMRTRTALLRLRVDENTDIAALDAYWTLGVKRKEVLPILRSIVRDPDTAGLDIIHLLPPHARQLLYTYPDLADPDVARKDCNWSSFNFFRPVADMALADPAAQDRMLAAEFEPAGPPYRFGDLLTLAYPGQDFFHSAVYIAADFVYTRNGTGLNNPWVLMTLEDLRTVYYARSNWEIRAWRWLGPASG